MSISRSQNLSVMSQIKCSSCGKAISITSLSSHICDASLEYTAPPPPPKSQFKLDMPRYDPAVQFGYGDKNLPIIPATSDSIWNNKPLPPRINPDYANDIFSDTPPYSAGGSSYSSRDGRSASPMTPSTQITSPGTSYFGREKLARTPSPPSEYQYRSESPSKMALTSISESPPPVPSKQGPNVFQRLNAGVAGPFSKGPPGRRAGPGLPSSPASTVDRKPRTEDTMGREFSERERERERERRTPSPINDTLMALSGRRPSVDKVLSSEKSDTTERSYGYQSSWDTKPLPTLISETIGRQESIISHTRDDSMRSLGPSFQTESKYVPWWLKDSNSSGNNNDIDNNKASNHKNNESVNSWDRPLPPIQSQLRTIDESPPSRPKTANPDAEKSRRNPFESERGTDPAIQYGLDDSSKPRNNSGHFYSNSDPEKKLEQTFGKTNFTHNYNIIDDNPFSSAYSDHRHNHNQHSHQHSQQSFSSNSSNKLALSPSSQSPSSNSSPQRVNNWPSTNTTAVPLSTSTSVTKHNCRGCSHVIHGRSLVDSSKRLTGRYHKECFVCTDCRAPFPSGEFYVLDNLPYCAFDYHRKNKSLCSGCGIGVEGSYLQTDGDSSEREGKLWHLECFSCAKCGCVLREEYWEMDGKALCTKDAFPNGFGFGAQNNHDGGKDRLGVLNPNFGSPSLSPGGRNPERRRTKLFMGSNGAGGASPGMGMGLGMSGFGGMGMGGGGYGRNPNQPQRRW